MGLVVRYTTEEIEYIKTNIGRKSISAIAAYLGRSELGIIRKMENLGINTMENTESITAYRLASELNHDSHVVLRWVNQCGLEHERIILHTVREHIMINPQSFWKWAKENTDEIDFRKFDEYVLMPQPKWVAEVRSQQYRETPLRSNKNWTSREDAFLVSYWHEGLTYAQIGEKLNRTKVGVQKRMDYIRDNMPHKLTKSSVRRKPKNEHEEKVGYC